MTRKLRAVAVIAATVVAMMAMSVSAAFAQYPPGPAFSVTCTAAGEAGSSVTCNVVGAADSEVLSVSAAYNPVFFTDTIVASAEGEATFRFTVPRDARGEDIVVTVTGPISGEISTVLSIAAPGRTGEPVPPGRPALATTGTNLMLLTGVGVVLLGGGIAAVRSRRSTAKV